MHRGLGRFDDGRKNAAPGSSKTIVISGFAVTSGFAIGNAALSGFAFRSKTRLFPSWERAEE
jgi:hypothetical protein